MNHLYKFNSILLVGCALAFLYFGGRMTYNILDAPKPVTMRELAQRGEDFTRLKITDPGYQVMKGESYKYWDIIPLQQQGDVQLLYVSQGGEFYPAFEAGDTSLHPHGAPKEIVVANMNETFVPGKAQDELLNFIDSKFPGKKIVFEEYEAPSWWSVLIIWLVALVLSYAGIRRVRWAFLSSKA